MSGQYREWIALPTFICSSLSAIATGTVIMMWIKSNNADKWGFRYMLIMNLTVAEFINSWGNTLSGYQVISSREWLTPGLACDLNGWVGQASVQAADFSVLAIAITTLLTVRFSSFVLRSSRYKQYLVCAAIWIIPLITATIALATGNIAPVSGNWCWIARDPVWLRYVLGHGWRYTIFIVVIAIYISLFVTVRKRLAQRHDTQALNPRYSFGMYDSSATASNTSLFHDELIRGQTLPTTVREAVTRSPSYRNKETGLEDAQTDKLEAQRRLGVKPRVRILPSSGLDRDTKHWLLLSLFPMGYIIVWIPGLVNRLFELVGHRDGGLTALQATTQLTGLVNALVYGFREHKGMQRRKTAMRQRVDQKTVDLDI